MKISVLSFSVVFSLITGFFTKFDNYLGQLVVTLLLMMLVDFTLGILGAFISRSSKTENGALSSRICLNGIFKKIAMLLCIIIGIRFDIYFDFDDIAKNSITLSFILVELISIVENLGTLGVPIPTMIKNIIEVLKNKEKEM